MLENDTRCEYVEAFLTPNPLEIEDFTIDICPFFRNGVDISINKLFSGLYQSNKFLFLH